MSFERLPYDECAYEAQLRMSTGPAKYILGAPLNDADVVCTGGAVADPALRLQNYGRGMCAQGANVDTESALRNLGNRASECDASRVRAGDRVPAGCAYRGNAVADASTIRKCYTPVENTRLSNPPSSLRDTGVNRWHPLCFDPQDPRRIENMTATALGVSSRQLAKDNHTACVLERFDEYALLPPPAPAAPPLAMENFAMPQGLPASWTQPPRTAVQTAASTHTAFNVVRHGNVDRRRVAPPAAA